MPMRWMSRHSMLPVLVSVTAALSIAQANPAEMGMLDLAVGLVLSVAIGGLCVSAGLLMERASPHKQAMLSGIVAAWLLLSAPLVPALSTALAGYGPFAGLAHFRWVIALFTAAAMAAIWYVKFRLRTAERAFQVVSVALLCMILAFLWRFTSARAAFGDPPIDVPAVATGNGAAARPSVFLIVVDAYAGKETLARLAISGAGEFSDSLRDLGFQVPQRVRSNYAWTALSLASMLNMGYVDSIAQRQGPTGLNMGPLYKMISRSRVAREFQELGYDYYLVPSLGFRGTQYSETARRIVRVQTGHAISDFLTGRPFTYAVLQRVLPINVATTMGWISPFDGYDAAALDSTASLAAVPGNKFVISHLMMTHAPFLLGADCSRARMATHARTESVLGYGWSVHCVNVLLLKAIHRILQQTNGNVIILLQADHGVLMGTRVRNSKELAWRSVESRFDTFAAYYAPRGILPAIDSMSAVNLFRVVLPRLGSPPMDLLPDRYAYSALYRLYDLAPVKP